MSDGGRERRKFHESSDPQKKPGTDSFARAIVRVGVGQICENEGFQAFQQFALDALSDIAIRYMLDIGKTAVSAANFAGRTEPNAFDIIHGIEHLCSIVGFSGASDVDRCLLSSGTAREILNYVEESKEIPFAYRLPSLPVLKDWRQSPSFLQSREEPPQKHIPSWLPKFPICQTGEEKEPAKAENSLSNLHHGITCNGSGPSTETKEEKNPGINPFLAEPICSGVKEVSPVVPPSKVDAQFANEVVGNHIECEQTSGGEKISRNQISVSQGKTLGG
ncbi:hypothetical protein CRG98_035884 [Punica granatum]|uniref:Bromodomain associated domain-containing protein n=1 Tax=Punica granatum TaxID=22663 RepID=A0A2I0II91_PUNGR|nr:hypothetical protein CRG98_035884 [Punica granatum]